MPRPRIIIVHNPRSSQAWRVEVEVIEAARHLKGFIVGKYAVAPTNVSANARSLAKIIEDGDLVISAGGDGTATIALNGVMLSKKQARLAVLPYGNFNDMARTLRTVTLKQAINGKVTKAWPLVVKVDGKHWRYAFCYVTLGLCAESTKVFENQKIRRDLQHGRRGSVISLWRLFLWWTKNRRRRFLGHFSLNGREVSHATDYFAVGGRYAAGVMKMPETFYRSDYFRSRTVRMSSFFGAVSFVVKAMVGRERFTKTASDTIEFSTPRNLTVQAEGESELISKVSKITISKAKFSIDIVYN